MDRISLVFCTLSLIITIGLAALGYPYAALPIEMVTISNQSVEAEEIPDIYLGDFGTVSVSEMLDYFIENPPVTSETAGESIRRIRIQGC